MYKQLKNTFSADLQHLYYTGLFGVAMSLRTTSHRPHPTVNRLHKFYFGKQLQPSGSLTNYCAGTYLYIISNV